MSLRVSVSAFELSDHRFRLAITTVSSYSHPEMRLNGADLIQIVRPFYVRLSYSHNRNTVVASLATVPNRSLMGAAQEKCDVQLDSGS